MERGADHRELSHLPGAVETHNYYKNLRDKLVAHAVNAFDETKIQLVLSPRGQPDDQGTVLWVMECAAHLSSHAHEGVSQLGRLSGEFIALVKLKIADCERRLLDEAKRLPIADLRRLEPWTFTPPGPEAAGKARK